ncbi:MAG TPA: hypothetical protein VFW23_09955 [Tepidisphaeraceae bacterium]|nr:hypothetical protein [Tepidisphaeraceae bacterium]
MERVREYLQQARECREAAAKAVSADVRSHYLSMAETWRTLAKQRAAQLHLEHLFAELATPEGDPRGGGG